MWWCRNEKPFTSANGILSDCMTNEAAVNDLPLDITYKKKHILDWNESLPYLVEVSLDQNFVVQYLAGLDGKKKATWKVCYEEGKRRSLFGRFDSFLSLNDTLVS